MTKLNFHELVDFFCNRNDFFVALIPFVARIYKKGSDERLGGPYYMLIESDGDLVESIDFYVIRMQHNHMKKGEDEEDDSKYVKAFSFDMRDIESIEHLVNVCKNSFNQIIVEEIRYLQQQINKNE